MLADEKDKDIRAQTLALVRDGVYLDSGSELWTESPQVTMALFSIFELEDDTLHSDARTTLEFYFGNPSESNYRILNNLRSHSNTMVADAARRIGDNIISTWLDRAATSLPRQDGIREFSSDNPVVVLLNLEEISRTAAEHMVATYRNANLNSADMRSNRIANVVEHNLVVIEQLVPYTKHENPEIRQRATDLIRRIRFAIIDAHEPDN